MEPAPRAKALGYAAVLVLALHGALLFGFQWKTGQGAFSPLAGEQGIEVDLAPAPEAGRLVAEPAPAPLSSLQQKAEPAAQPVPLPAAKKEPEQARPRAAEARTRSTSAASAPQAQAGQAAGSAASAPDSPEAASSPEALSSYANPKPAYPELARRRGQEGLVRLLAQVDEQGGLAELLVEKSSGFPLLDEAALKAVRKWRFKPGSRGGRPVRGSVLIPVEFLLKQSLLKKP
jgi:protein TonB